MENKFENIQIQITQPFGPSIVKLKLPDEFIIKMNEYVEEINKDKKKLRELDNGPNLVGAVKQEIILEKDFMRSIKWNEFLTIVCKTWLRKKEKIEIKGISLRKTWIVSQFKGEYNPIHDHSGHISGVGYLKVPENMGNLPQTNKENKNGCIEFLYGSSNTFSHPTIAFKPEVGDFFMFPNYLLHTVYPFTGTDEERRSVSFNATIDELK
tara:strand:- start:260 stop:889 length:630 start_codon:yes stop_codon:yes gene_type:complete